MTLPQERQENYQRQPPPPGYVVWQGANPIDDPTTGHRWVILIPDLQRADMLSPQLANYAYKNMKLYNMITGETRLGSELLTDYDKTTETVDQDPKSPTFGKPIPGSGKQKSVLESIVPAAPFLAAASYQALTNELISEGVPEEVFNMKEVQEYLAPMMKEVALGRSAEQVKPIAEWMKYLAEDAKQTKQTQEAWKLQRQAPANVWLDKDIMRQMNPEGYHSDEYQWQPLVKKATAKPQRISTL